MKTPGIHSIKKTIQHRPKVNTRTLRARIMGALVKPIQNAFIKIRKDLREREITIKAAISEIPQLAPKITDGEGRIDKNTSARTIAALLVFLNPLGNLVKSAHAWTPETQSKFNEALNANRRIEQMVNRTTAITDSTQLQLHYAEIDSAASDLKSRISDATNSMFHDFRRMIAEDRANELRRDVRVFEAFTQEVGDDSLKQEAGKLKKYIDDLIMQRILAEKEIGEAQNQIRHGRYEESIRIINKLLDNLEKYPHLNYYVYCSGVLEVFFGLDFFIEREAGQGNFNEAYKMLQSLEKLSNHIQIANLKNITETELLQPLRNSISEGVLYHAKMAANRGEFGEAEHILKEVKRKLPQCHEIIDDANHEIFQSKKRFLSTKIQRYEFDDARKDIEIMEKKHPEFKKEINKDDIQSKVSEVISNVKEWKDGDEGAIDELISRLSPDKFKNKNSLDFYKVISNSLFK